MTRTRAAVLCGALLGGAGSAPPGYDRTILNVTEGGYYKGDFEKGVVLDMGEAFGRGWGRRRLSSLFHRP
jgi:hypothetical protein